MRTAVDLEADLRGLLAEMPASTATAGYWVVDAATEKRAQDNFNAGRLDWNMARRAIVLGLEAVAAGNLDVAEEFISIAESFQLSAFRRKMTRQQLADLTGNAGLRGRTTNLERNERLAAAVAAQETIGLKGMAARNAAINADAFLTAEFGQMGDAGIRAALRKALKT